MVEADAGGQPSGTQRVIEWVLSHAKVTALPLVAATAFFITEFVAVSFQGAAILRAAALMVAPAIPRSRFEPDRLHIKMVVTQGSAVVIGEVMRAAANGMGAPTHPVAALVTFYVFLVMWLETHVVVREYTEHRGGLLSAYRVRTPTEKVVALFKSNPPSLSDVGEAVVRAAVGVVALAAIATASYTEVAARRDDARKPRSSDRSGAEVPQNPDADAYCGFNVYRAIARDIPTNIAIALASVYGGTFRRGTGDAPGARFTGCPTDHTVRTGDLYVTRLRHPETREADGLLVSDAAGHAAVVFSKLRSRTDELIDAQLLVRIDGRTRTRLGDEQLFHLTGGTCSLAIREYNHEYVVLPAVMTRVAMTLAVERREVPRITVEPAPQGRTTYTLAFRESSPVTTIYDAALATVITGSGGTQVSNTDPACPAAEAFHRLAESEAPPAAGETP